GSKTCDGEHHEHAAPPMIAPPMDVFTSEPVAGDPKVLFPSTNALICAAVAPLVGDNAGRVSVPVVLFVVIRMKLPACHAPLRLLPVISAHPLIDEPPLLPVDTTMPRWNKGEPVVSGSAMVLLVMRATTVVVAAVTEFVKLMAVLFTWRMSLPETVALKVPPV